MSTRKNKLPARRNNDSEALSYRVATVIDGATADDTRRAIPVTLATESPVQVYDVTRNMVISEVLTMAGAELPQQVPMCDTHNHETVRSILGSVRDLKVSGDSLQGVAYFGSKQVAREAYDDAKDGHLTDISVGAKRLEEHFVPKGKSERVGDKEIHGPARIVTRWRPLEGSAAPIGADPRSTFESNVALRAYLDPVSMRDEAMDESFRALLVSLGMPEGHDDEQALAWAKENTERKAAPVNKDAAKGQGDKANDDGNRTNPGLNADELTRHVQKQERDRCVSIRNAVKLAEIDDSFADAFIADGIDAGEASKRALIEQGKKRKALGITAGPAQLDSFRAAVLDGMTARVAGEAALSQAGRKPVAGHAEFKHTRLIDLAKRCLAEEGTSVRHMDDRDVMRHAFAQPSTTRASDGQAYLVSGTFANLLLDASNKALLKSFADVPTTYQAWTHQGESVDDFKNINRIRLGEVGNQPTVPENDEYKDMSLSDSKESYRVEKRGSLISLTWEAMKNDDLGGFTRLVQLQASAMKRTINRSVYQILFDNPTLSDGVAIFHSSSHGANLVTSAISVTSLNTAYSAMMLQTGLNSDTILGIVPRTLVVAPGISGTAYQLVNSIADPAAGGSAVGNSGNANIYGPGGPRQLQVIVEPVLAGNDVDSWYLMADPMQVDTIEVTFLRGEESPVFEQESAFVRDAVSYKIRQTWGVKAIDYRGMYKSTG